MSDATRLGGVPQTLLWTLHNRAREAMRADAWLYDPEAVRLYHAIDFDYEAHFRRPDASHAVRSLMFDEALRPWLAAHPGGTVVELGCGLETQFQRCDDGRVNWLCVDLPETLAVRERLLPPLPRCRHLALSALDTRWIDAVDAGRGVFVSAQGLFMYFDESELRRLFCAIVDAFPGAELMFDVIPRWFSRKTLRGLQLTPHYRAPLMPWGVDRDEIEPLLRSWTPRLASVHEEPYRRVRGFAGALMPMLAPLPWVGRLLPAIVRVRVADRAAAACAATALIEQPRR
ncbi:methyltransferase [Rubrivivax gelatinosus]|nr:methyltransferase [Rubrivivax gelatinosus]